MGEPHGEEDEDEDEAEPEMDLHVIAPAAVKQAAAAVAAVVPEPTRSFVVSKTKKVRFRPLHCVEACRLVPGIHYKVYDVWGGMLPPENEIDAVCARCLPRGPPAPPGAQAPRLKADRSDASSSSFSRAASAGVQAKKPRLLAPRAASC